MEKRGEGPGNFPAYDKSVTFLLYQKNRIEATPILIIKLKIKSGIGIPDIVLNSIITTIFWFISDDSRLKKPEILIFQVFIDTFWAYMLY